MMLLPRQNTPHALLAGTLLLLCLVSLYLLAAPALYQRVSFRERLSDIRFQHARYSTVLKNKDSIVEELVKLRTSTQENSGFLEEKPAALAAADLQNYLQGLIESHGGVLISTQILPQSGTDVFPSVTVKVQMRCDINSLRGMLLGLETGPLYLRLENLFLQGHYQPVARNNRSRSPLPESGMIEARFDISGYIFQTGPVTE